jgi:threonine aldolase
MGGGLVDLRSDTVTRPTPAMRRAMAGAEVGDDVYGEDPTVNALQEAFADRVGKEAALFVPSGTMGNQLALRLLAPPGTTVVAGRRQHVVIYENGAGGRNAAVQFHTVDDGDGTIAAADVAWAVEAVAHHHPRPSVVCIENTHMPANGVPWSEDRLRDVAGAAAAGGLALHLDGARLFNAEVATGTPAAAWAGPAASSSATSTPSSRSSAATASATPRSDPVGLGISHSRTKRSSMRLSSGLTRDRLIRCG